MRLPRVLLTTLLVCSLLPINARAQVSSVVTNGDARAELTPDGPKIWSAGRLLRWWRPDRLVTYGFGDQYTLGQADFSLQLGAATIPSGTLTIDAVRAEETAGGVRLVWELSLPGLLRATRTVEAFPGIKGLRSRTVLHPLVPLSLGGYTVDEFGVHAGIATIHAFRAGADWRYNDDFDPVNVGDDHLGHWRETVSASAPEEPLSATGEWMSIATPNGTLGVVLERRNAASSVASYGTLAQPNTGNWPRARIGVDFSRDIVYTGPFEESIHVENPLDPLPDADVQDIVRTPQPGARARALIPGRPLALEEAFSIPFATGPDDEAWQYYKYLTRHRLTPYKKAVTFNTNGVDDNVISTGAKDDVDFDRFVSLAAAAREMGVETFILDDGWQARSGDWCPDSPQCPEPRHDGVDPRFAPRFPDDEFRAVREVLAGDPGDPADDMELGLWMTPMEFHPSSAAFTTNPQWACAPVGHATGAASFVDQGGSFDAGIGVWNPMALGAHPDSGEPLRLSRYIEDRIRRAIDVYGARYFKFDFLVWVDCAGIEPTDMYTYHDEFVAMVDRLQATYPHVTFSIDETNDYRMFPFEQVARGPSWFQNGHPPMRQLLHNQWNLAPFVPGFSLGQHAASRDSERALVGVDKAMAVTLGQHITFWNELDTAFTPAERAQVRRWTDFYKQHRDTLAQFTLPLLADPLENDWTALQPWNPDEQSGWVLAYRQQGALDTVSIPLRAVTGDGSYTLVRHDPADGTATPVGTVTADDLRAGISVTIGETDGYALIRIEPA